MHYKRAPIVEAVLEFRWEGERKLEQLKAILDLEEFRAFGEPKARRVISATLDIQEATVTQGDTQIGFELSARDGSEAIFLEKNKFVFIKRAPYDSWKSFSKRALAFFEQICSRLEIDRLSRLGVRFVNRIDIPIGDDEKFKTDDYITISFNGPRNDTGVIDEFQMRLVKPTEQDGIAYALIVATIGSPLTNHGGILLDIDVFTRKPIPAGGNEFSSFLSIMHDEKNSIFESCITDKSRELFGGII